MTVQLSSQPVHSVTLGNTGANRVPTGETSTTYHPSKWFLQVCQTNMLSLLWIILMLRVLPSITEPVDDINHDYYTISIHKSSGDNGRLYNKHYVEMSDSSVHEYLSTQSIGAEKIAFKFPFYGHPVDSLYITTHGFLSFSSNIHSQIYQSEYVAPLRLKLDPSQHDESTVKYKIWRNIYREEESLTVQWSNMSVIEHPENGNFSFQVTLHEDGEICFVFIQVHNLNNFSPSGVYDREVVSGISDAFMKGRQVYKYHELNVPQDDIEDGTVVIFRPLPSCKSYSSCQECAATNCIWCPLLDR